MLDKSRSYLVTTVVRYPTQLYCSHSECPAKLLRRGGAGNDQVCQRPLGERDVARAVRVQLKKLIYTLVFSRDGGKWEYLPEDVITVPGGVSAGRVKFGEISKIKQLSSPRRTSEVEMSDVTNVAYFLKNLPFGNSAEKPWKAVRTWTRVFYAGLVWVKQ